MWYFLESSIFQMIELAHLFLLVNWKKLQDLICITSMLHHQILQYINLHSKESNKSCHVIETEPTNHWVSMVAVVHDDIDASI